MSPDHEHGSRNYLSNMGTNSGIESGLWLMAEFFTGK